MIIGGCQQAVWEYNLPMARELIAARKRQGFRIIHGWWNHIEGRWENCVSKLERLGSD